MSKKIFILFLTLIMVTSVFAIELDIHSGILSGVGIIWSSDKWQFNAGLETGFPVVGIINGVSAKMFNENVSFKEGFKLGCNFYYGMNLSAFRQLFAKGRSILFAGATLFSGIETPTKLFKSVLKPEIIYSFAVSERTDIYAALGVSLVEMNYIKGFKKPLFKIPKFNYYSELTGCRLGVSVDLSQKGAER